MKISTPGLTSYDMLNTLPEMSQPSNVDVITYGPRAYVSGSNIMSGSASFATNDQLQASNQIYSEYVTSIRDSLPKFISFSPSSSTSTTPSQSDLHTHSRREILPKDNTLAAVAVVGMVFAAVLAIYLIAFVVFITVNAIRRINAVRRARKYPDILDARKDYEEHPDFVLPYNVPSARLSLPASMSDVDQWRRLRGLENIRREPALLFGEDLKPYRDDLRRIVIEKKLGDELIMLDPYRPSRSSPSLKDKSAVDLSPEHPNCYAVPSSFSEASPVVASVSPARPSSRVRAVSFQTDQTPDISWASTYHLFYSSSESLKYLSHLWT